MCGLYWGSCYNRCVHLYVRPSGRPAARLPGSPDCLHATCCLPQQPTPPATWPCLHVCCVRQAHITLWPGGCHIICYHCHINYLVDCWAFRGLNEAGPRAQEKCCSQTLRWWPDVPTGLRRAWETTRKLTWEAASLVAVSQTGMKLAED